jgi:uncharacterized membrane protein
MKTKLLSLIFLGLFILGNSQTILAQQSQDNNVGLSVFPAIIELNGDPGQAIRQDLTITNTTQASLPVDLAVRSLIPIDSIIDLSRREQFDASKWISLQTEQFALEPGASKKIEIITNIPNDATPGGHYAEVYIKSLQIQTSVNNKVAQTRIIPEIKVPVLIKVSGDAKEELTIKQQNVFPATAQKGMPLTTTISIANTGTVHLLPTISVQLLKGDTITQETIINPFIVLPNTVKTIELPWTPNVSSGLYNATVQIKYGTSQQTQRLSPESLFVLPALYFVIGLPLLVISVVYLIIKRRNIKLAIKTLIASSSK